MKKFLLSLLFGMFVFAAYAQKPVKVIGKLQDSFIVGGVMIDTNCNGEMDEGELFTSSKERIITFVMTHTNDGFTAFGIRMQTKDEDFKTLGDCGKSSLLKTKTPEYIEYICMSDEGKPIFLARKNLKRPELSYMLVKNPFVLEEMK